MKRYILLLFLSIGLFAILKAQNKFEEGTLKVNSEAYLFFDAKENCENVSMFEREIANTILYVYGDLNSKIPERRHFNAIDSSEYIIVDSLYLKQFKIKSPSWHFDKENHNTFGLEFDSQGNLTDKRSYYRQIFIIDKIGPNKFKIIQAVPYIGSIYYAPMR